MGLDTVEYVMEIEETFGISLEDPDCGRVRTFGELQSLVLAKLRARAAIAGPCPTRGAFYMLRRALVLTLDAPRRAVRLETSTEELLRDRDREQVWTALGRSIGVDLPRLEREPKGFPWLPLNPRSRIPQGCEDLRGLVRELVRRRHGTLAAGMAPSAADDVWEKLAVLASDTSGIDPAQIYRALRIADVMS